MKRLPVIIGAVLGFVAIILIGVFVYDSMIRAPRAAQKAKDINSYTLPEYREGISPKSSFPEPETSNSSVAPVADDIDGLQKQLEETQSIDTSTEVTDLQNEAQGL